jgi:phage tail sheath protein FI
MQWRGEFNSSYAGCYYPWLVIPDPLQLEGIVRSIPPSGHMAGIFARVEQTTGVHKPPANEIVEGAEDVVTSLGDIVHGLLNDEQVNVIRPFSGRRVRVAGGRTVSDAPAWRFLNVRRLFIAIERSVRMNLQWIAFEPSNPGLWLQVDRVMRSFLEGLWMRGLLDGDTRDAAYSVTCDATTNPGPETDNGRVICEIGVLPPWPAEFVTVRIGITEGGVEMLTPAEVQVA